MAEFVTRLKNEDRERVFIKKLENNFNNINSKNILLDRSLTKFYKDEKIIAIFELKPVVPNVPIIASLFVFLLYGSIYLIWGRIVNILLYGSLGLLLLSFFWTKYFYYLILKISSKKHNVKMELI